MGRSELIPGRVESRMQAGRQADKRWRNFFNNLFSRSVIGVVGERTTRSVVKPSSAQTARGRERDRDRDKDRNNRRIVGRHPAHIPPRPGREKTGQWADCFVLDASFRSPSGLVRIFWPLCCSIDVNLSSRGMLRHVMLDLGGEGM